MKQTSQASARQSEPAAVFLHFGLPVRWPYFFAVVGCLLLLAQAAWPQRPVLRYARRENLAGSLLLIPANAQLHALALPKQFAALADHQLQTPPVGALGDGEQLSRWAAKFDYSETAGVLLALDALLAVAPEAKTADGAARLSFLKDVRAARPTLPLYASADLAHVTSVVELLDANLLDYVLFVAPQGAPPELLKQITERAWQDRVGFVQQAETATLLLQARLLNRRFGVSPKVVTVLSTAGAAAWQTTLRAQLATLDANEIANNGAPVAPDLLLFIHTPQTAPPQVAALANALEKAANDGFRCALLDLSHDRVLQESLLNQLRSRKLLDHLTGYAAALTATDDAKASARLLAQTNARLLALRFLRDDVERLRRTEAAQVGVLLSSYLRDWAYPATVQASVQAKVAALTRTGAAPAATTGEAVSLTEEAEAAALAALNPLAEKLFEEQFRRNMHAVLLASNERAEFEIKLLQRLLVRFVPGVWAEPEIRVATYLAYLGNFVPQPAPPVAVWDFVTGRELDERLSKRFDQVSWSGFKTDVEVVELSLKLNQNQQAQPEAYTLRSRRNGQTRRIEINAGNAQGAFYALGRLEQLGADGLLAQDQNLTERPSLNARGFIERSNDVAWSQRERLEALRFLGRVRLNRYVYASAFDPLRRERWREPYAYGELARFRELAQTARANFVTPVYLLNPGASLRYSNAEDWAALTAKLGALASVGLYEFVLSFEDAPTQLADANDRTQFVTLGTAQAQLAQRLVEWQAANCPNCRLALLPSNPTEPAARQTYLQQLGAQLPANVGLIWLGSENFLPEYAQAQAEEFAKLTKRAPQVWSSFPAYNHAGARLFLGAKRNEASAFPQTAAGLLGVLAGSPQALRLTLATLADYAWDSRSYNADRSLESALNLLIDERGRAGLRAWMQTYGKGGNGGNGGNVPRPHGNGLPPQVFDPLFAASATTAPPNFQLLEAQAKALQTALEALGGTRDRGLLRGELAAVLRRVQMALAQARK